MVPGGFQASMSEHKKSVPVSRARNRAIFYGKLHGHCPIDFLSINIREV